MSPNARGDVVALLNDDAVAGPSWLDKRRARSSPAGDVGAVAPRVLLARRFAEVILDDEDHWVDGDEPAPRAPAHLGGPRRRGRAQRSRRAGHPPTRGGARRAALALDGRPPALLRADRRRAGARGSARHLRSRSTSAESAGRKRAPATASSSRSFSTASRYAIGRVVDLVNSAGSYLREDGYAGDCGADLPDDDHWSTLRECFAVSGAALVTTASVLARVGPFERSYFAYYEDTDWCWRARLLGYRIMYDPSSTVRHVRGQTSGGTIALRTRFLAERNRLLTLARCAPLRLAAREVKRKWSGGGDDGVAARAPASDSGCACTAGAPATPLGGRDAGTSTTAGPASTSPERRLAPARRGAEGGDGSSGLPDTLPYGPIVSETRDRPVCVGEPVALPGRVGRRCRRPGEERWP